MSNQQVTETCISAIIKTVELGYKVSPKGGYKLSGDDKGYPLCLRGALEVAFPGYIVTHSEIDWLAVESGFCGWFENGDPEHFKMGSCLAAFSDSFQAGMSWTQEATTGEASLIESLNKINACHVCLRDGIKLYRAGSSLLCGKCITKQQRGM